MAKSIQQAEAELRTAALEFAVADAEYSRQYAASKEHERYEAARKIGAEHVLLPETVVAVRECNLKHEALAAAARGLASAVGAQRRAEAL